MAPKRFKMVGYAGSTINLPFWGAIKFDVAGMTMKPRLPVLREHKRDRAVGVLDKLSKETCRLVGEGFFVDSPDGREIQDLLRQGFPMQASVGISIRLIEEVKKGASALVNGETFQGPGVIVRQSEILEISAVTLGADGKTSVDFLAASRGGNMPQDFDEAVNEKLLAGLPVEAAIAAAARDYPALCETYRQAFNGEPDPQSADAILARRAEELAAREGISLEEAQLRVFQEDPVLASQWLIL
jgi:hypothetical protein